ncbi:MAG: hypothetical protein LBM60_09250 [Clostridium sp.]|jgi:hypothetical protein|nr:hypothetical protein [Clostridium sp.]
MASIGSVKLLIAFVGRGEGNELSKYLQKNQIDLSFQCIGHGTATSELMDVLGLGSSQKDVLIAMTNAQLSAKVLTQLAKASGQVVSARGIVFDLSLTGLSNRIAAVLLNTNQNLFGGEPMESKQQDNSLLLIIVNQGYTAEIMDTARAAGAGGGTILKARYSGNKENDLFHGIEIQAEKEILAIVTPTESRNVIMETINKKHGKNTKAEAILCSLGIDQLVKL